jgi:hypothetical protein
VRRFAVACCFILVCGSAFAADLTGTWTGQLPPRPNAQDQGLPPYGADITFQFTQSGNALTGKQYGDYRSSAITGGQIEADQVKFTVVITEQAGNQVNLTKYVYTGTLNGDELKLTRERASSVTVGNGEIAPNRNNAPQTFTLKRLL